MTKASPVLVVSLVRELSNPEKISEPADGGGRIEVKRNVDYTPQSKKVI